MEWTNFSSGVIGAVLATGIGAYINYRFWQARAKITEAREKERRIQENSTAVAEILAEWIRPFYTGERSNEYLWRLQTTYWKNILRLDRSLLEMLIQRLANEPDAPSTNELIVQARKYLLNLPDTDISANQLNNWLPIKKVK